MISYNKKLIALIAIVIASIVLYTFGAPVVDQTPSTSPATTTATQSALPTDAIASSTAAGSRSVPKKIVPVPATAPVEVTDTSPAREQTDPRSMSVIVGEATYVGSVPAGSTVLDLMNALKAEGLRFEGKEFPGLGLRIDSVNGVSSDNGYYWFLYVNGKSSDAGVSQTKVLPGDVVEWRYKNGY